MRYLLAILFCFAAFAQRTPRVVDSAAALVALTPSATVPDVIVVSTNNNTRLQFRYYPTATDATNTTSPLVYATSTGTGRWKEVRLTGDLTSVTVNGSSIDASAKLNITNGTAVNLTGSLTNVTLLGSLTYDLTDESDLTFGNDYGAALDVGPTSTSFRARLRTVSTIADLVAADPTTSDVFSYVKVLGYNSAGDGGDGDFRRVLASSITNAGSITRISTHNPTYGWERLWNGTTVEAAWFGAMAGDGVDDSAAIQSALDYVHSLGRGTVQLGGGRYDIGSTLKVPYRVNLIGSAGWKLGEFAASISTNVLFLTGGPTMLRLADGANTDMLWLDSTDGFLRQPAEVIEDGETLDGRFQDSVIQNIVFFGNAANQTKYNCRGIVAKAKWTGNIRNCAFVYIKGFPLYLFDCNAFIVDDIWISSGHTSTFGKGFFLYSSADNFFGRIYAGGARGPVIWGNSSSTFKNVFSDQIVFNAVRTNTLNTVSSWATNTLANFAAELPLETGEPVELRTDGTLPPPFTDTQLYFVVKLATNIYGFHTNYALATNGVYLAGTGAASGTSYLTLGPATGLYLSGGAGQNVFSGLRSDQNSGPGVVLRGANGNFISGLEAGENNGVQNGELTVPDDEKASVIFDKDAQNNQVIGTSYSENIGFNVRSNATANVMSAVMTGVLTNTINTSSGVNYTPVNRTLTGTATWGESTTQTALDLTGNSGGQRIIKLSRTSGLTQQIGLGVGQDALNVWNETDSRGIALIGNTGTIASYQFGDTSSATPPTAEIYGTAGSGTNKGGAALKIYVDQSTGNADTTDAFSVLTGDAGSSGSAAQSMTTKFVVEGDGDVRVAGTSMTLNGVAVATKPTTETLTYSGGTNVTITAGKGPMQRSVLTVTNNFQLLWSGLTDNDSGVVHLIPDTTNRTILVSSPGRAAGSSAATATGSTTLTITGATNGWAELAWSVVPVGGTNRVSVNLGAY
jgi:hypothetical protein